MLYILFNFKDRPVKYVILWSILSCLSDSCPEFLYSTTQQSDRTVVQATVNYTLYMNHHFDLEYFKILQHSFICGCKYLFGLIMIILVDYMYKCNTSNYSLHIPTIKSREKKI